MGAEAIVFAVDVDTEVGQEAVKGSTRLDILRQCISFFINSKRRVNPKHLFGIASVDETSTLLTPRLTSSVDELEEAAQKLHPRSGPCGPLDLGSLTSLGRALGVQAAKVRVILIYCRSNILTTWTQQHLGGIALDVLYVHEKPSPGVNRPQEVYNALEEQADSFARQAGHAAYIFEASAQNHRKIFGLMVLLMANPSTRPAQQQLPATPLDLASTPVLQTNLPTLSHTSPPQAHAAFVSPSSSAGHSGSVGHGGSVGAGVGASPPASLGTPASVTSSPAPPPPAAVTTGAVTTGAVTGAVTGAATGLPVGLPAPYAAAGAAAALPYGAAASPATPQPPAAGGVGAGVGGGVGAVPYPVYPAAAAHVQPHPSAAICVPAAGVNGTAAGQAVLGPFTSVAEAGAAAARLPPGTQP